MVTTEHVMLASPMSVIARSQQHAVSALAGRSGWTFDLKADGIRALITRHANGTQILNRRGADITWRYPDVCDQMRPMPEGVYDGEIVCVVDGRIDFPAIHRRDSRGNPRSAHDLAATLPATFLAFDLLSYEGSALGQWPLSERRAALKATGVTMVPTFDHLPALWHIVEREGLEGVVAKRLDSRYEFTRSRNWVKIKRTHTVTCVVLGAVTGEGSRAATVGALRAGVVLPDGSLKEIAKVGSGFTLRDLDDLTAQGEDVTGSVIEVGYLDVSPSGMLRQPVFLRHRSDVDLRACTSSQLDTDLARQRHLR